MRGVLQVLALVAGLSAVVLGVLIGSSYALLPWLGLDDAPQTVAAFTVAGATVASGCGLGLPLAWTALQSLRGRPSPELRWPRFWPLLLLFLLVAAAGGAVLGYAPLPWLFFPGFYVLAILLPVIAVLSLVGRQLAHGGMVVTRREILAQLSSGGLLGTGSALLLETVLILFLALVAVLIIDLMPGGADLLYNLMDDTALLSELSDPTILLPLLRSPWLVGLAFLGIALLAPAIEEAVKALGVPLMGYRQPGPGRAFLWGVASGAGLALVEGLLNSTLSLSVDRSWFFTVVARAGTVVIHCLAGGLVGWGWQALYSRTRRWRALLRYLAAVALHGSWNGLVAGVALVQLLSSADPEGFGRSWLGGFGTGLLGALALVVLGVQFFLLLAIAKRLAWADDSALI